MCDEGACVLVVRDSVRGDVLCVIYGPLDDGGVPEEGVTVLRDVFSRTLSIVAMRSIDVW